MKRRKRKEAREVWRRQLRSIAQELPRDARERNWLWRYASAEFLEDLKRAAREHSPGLYEVEIEEAVASLFYVSVSTFRKRLQRLKKMGQKPKKMS